MSVELLLATEPEEAASVSAQPAATTSAPNATAGAGQGTDTTRERNRWRLDIGGLSLHATVPDGWRLVETDPAYEGFLSLDPAWPCDCPEDVAVELTFEPPRFQQAETFEALPRVFDTEETWQLRRDGEDLLLRLTIPQADAASDASTAAPTERESEGDGYLWLARFAAEPSRNRGITVHCGELLRHGEERGLLQNPLHYPLDQLLLNFLLPTHGGFVCHAAGLFHRGRAILCAGKSGAGKTTISRLAASRSASSRSAGSASSPTGTSPAGTSPAGTLSTAATRSQRFDEPIFEVLSDDRVVLRQDCAGPRLYGTPWPGAGRMAVAASAPLAALVFLRHAAPDADRDTLTPLEPAQALDRMLPVSSILWFDRSRMEAALDVCAELVASVPAYELTFRPQPSALELLEPLFRDGSDLDDPNPRNRR